MIWDQQQTYPFFFVKDESGEPDTRSGNQAGGGFQETMLKAGYFDEVLGDGTDLADTQESAKEESKKLPVLTARSYPSALLARRRKWMGLG